MLFIISANIPANNAGTYTYSVWLRGPDGFTGGARIALLDRQEVIQKFLLI